MAPVVEAPGRRRGQWWPNPPAAPDRQPSGPLFEPTPWVTQAACRGRTEAMFPDPSDAEAVQLALKLCATCLVAEDCRTYAEGRGEKHGVWGGRLHDRPKRRRQPKPRFAVCACGKVCRTAAALVSHRRGRAHAQRMALAWQQPYTVERPTLPLEWPTPRRVRRVPCPYCGIVFRTLGSHLLHRHGVRRRQAA